MCVLPCKGRGASKEKDQSYNGSTNQMGERKEVEKTLYEESKRTSREEVI
jgi:hypothetical protein